MIGMGAAAGREEVEDSVPSRLPEPQSRSLPPDPQCRLIAASNLLDNVSLVSQVVWTVREAKRSSPSSVRALDLINFLGTLDEHKRRHCRLYFSSSGQHR